MTTKSAMTQQTFREIWRRAPLSDRKFVSTMIVIAEALELRGLRFGLLTPRMERLLKSCDRKTLFSILAECIGLLTKSPAMQRVKQAHRKRRARNRVPSGRRIGRMLQKMGA